MARPAGDPPRRGSPADQLKWWMFHSMLWFALATFAILLLLGAVVSLVFVCRWWLTVQNFYSAARSKHVTTIMKFFSGAIAFWSRSASTADKDIATIATTVGLIGLCTWELVGLQGDAQVEAGKKRYDKDLHILKEESYLRIKLLAALAGLVHQKKQHIWKEIERRMTDTSHNRIGSARDGFDVDRHMLTIIQQLAAFLRDQLPQVDESVEKNFRVGLYVEKSGMMVPIVSWDMLKRRESFFTSYQKYPKYFKLDCEDRPSCVVRCCNSRDILIISDCESELADFFHEEQKKYLKSLVAYPIHRIWATWRAHYGRSDCRYECRRFLQARG